MKGLHDGWGKRVKRTREERGISQRKLADLCDIDPSTVSRLERGTLAPRDDLKWRVAGALGVTVEELFPYPGVVPPFPAEVAS